MSISLAGKDMWNEMEEEPTGRGHFTTAYNPYQRWI
jgi:hypothetical protein